MDQRLKLQNLLEAIPGVKEVYFQAPANNKMVYPCILYTRDDEETSYADNSPYTQTLRYAVTVIDRAANSPIRAAVARLPLSSFNRHYKADNLNHDVYNLYY